MKFGVRLPNCGGGAVYPSRLVTTESIVKVAMEAEAAGFESICVNEHITPHRSISGLKPNFFEPMTTLSYLAGLTDHVGLCVGTVILPLRNVVILAKEASTLDVLSGGRLTLGVAVGRFRDEFDALNIPYEKRGPILTEGIRALKELLTKPRASFDGRYINFSGVEIDPKPIQDPLPIWVGGIAEVTIKKIARYADGWFPGIILPQEYEKGLELLRSFARDANRDLSKIEIALEILVSVAKKRDEAIRTFRKHPAVEHMEMVYRKTHATEKAAYEEVENRSLVGTPDDIVSQLERYTRIHDMHLVSIPTASTIEGIVRQMKLFSSEVVASLG